MEIYKLEETDISYKQIVDLLHESFKERLNQGLQYTCSFITEEKFRKITSKSIVFVAIDNKLGLCGTATLTIRKDHRNIKYGYNEYNGIRSDMKGKGIGSLLYIYREREALNYGCEYMMSDTSTQAKSAVKYHLKNGFKIIGLESYRSTNYWSYVFRKQLVPSKKWNCDFYCKLQYLKSWTFIRITRDINGNDSFFGKLYKVIRKKCKN